MKNVSIIIIQKIIVMLNAKHFNKIFLNENIKINIINYRYVIIYNITSIDNDFLISSHIKKKSMYCYNIYHMQIQFVDN